MKVQSNLTAQKKQTLFNLESELSKHAWFPKMTVVQAEEALGGKPVYTYLLRKSQNNLRKFDISYIDASGVVKHDTFTLINPKMGLFRNGWHAHSGKLEKVIRDMMHCEKHLGQPLTV